MRFGRALKIFAMALTFIIIIAVAFTYGLTMQATDALREEITQRLTATAHELGISLKFDDISFNPITGPALKGLSVSSITSRDISPLMKAKSIGLIYSLHLVPRFHVRIDGVRLVRPHIYIAIEDDGSTNLPDALVDLFNKDSIVEQGAGENLFNLASDDSVPVRVAQELRLVLRRGQLNIVDKRAVKTGEPAQIGLRSVSGSLTYDKRNGSMDLKTGGRIKGTSGRIDLKAEMKEGDFEITVRAKDVGLDALAGFVPKFVVASDDTVANLKLVAESKGKGSVWNADFGLNIDDVALDHQRLADRVIDDIDLTLSGTLRFNATDHRIEFQRLRIGTDNLFLNASGHAEFADGFILDTMIESRRMPIQRVLGAIPRGFAPVLKGAKVSGTIGIDISFGIDTKNLSALKFEPVIDVEGFKLIKAPDGVNIEKLKRPFMYKARKKGKVVKEFLVGHPNYWFVPYERLGKNTIKGVLTCEDGSFFRHDGFQVKHFRESLIQDIRERRFARGASTITMQTAKNLFLSGKKNLSRKFQEILIAYAMEQMLTKERILEIYMNIIEWGPNIYGVGAASKHYFDKWPKDLNPLEAAFLGSIIPTAVRSHYMYTQGNVPDQWATYLALIVSKMGVTGDEYNELEPFQPEFGWVRKEREAEEKIREADAD